MAQSDDGTSNVTQREYWTSQGDHWVQEADRYDAMNAGFGEVMLDAAALEPGDRVLDVGCGNGAATLDAALRVAPDGVVTGIDLSPPMLALARTRAVDAGVENLLLLQDDAQVHRFDDGEFDVIISRFGTMFFEDPEAAFSNLARGLRPGGRLSIVCWQDMLQSEWIIVPGAAAAAHVGLPDFGPPGSPGPFAFADPDRLRRIVESSGFVEVTVEAVTRPMRIGHDADDAVTFITSLQLVRDTMFAGRPADDIAAAVEAARQALVPYAGPDGVVMKGGAWLVTAGR